MAECKYGDCFGTENGNLGVKIWPSLCTRYPTDATTNGLYCRDVSGEKRLYVAPDAGARTFRQVRGFALSGPVDGPAISSFDLNGGTTGTDLINTRNGIGGLQGELTGLNPRGANIGASVLRNFSCARTWEVNLDEFIHFAVDIVAGANSKFILQTSTNYSTWTTRVAFQVDNRGITQTRRHYVFLHTNTIIGLVPNQVAVLDSRVNTTISGGSAILSEFQIYSEWNTSVKY